MGGSGLERGYWLAGTPPDGWSQIFFKMPCPSNKPLSPSFGEVDDSLIFLLPADNQTQLPNCISFIRQRTRGQRGKHLLQPQVQLGYSLQWYDPQTTCSADNADGTALASQGAKRCGLTLGALQTTGRALDGITATRTSRHGPGFGLGYVWRGGIGGEAGGGSALTTECTGAGGGLEGLARGPIQCILALGNHLPWGRIPGITSWQYKGVARP